MAWHAKLQLEYALEAGKTVARHTHNGPLRVLQSLYPDGDATCHNVLVHPPGGLVGGDTLDIAVLAHSGAHGLITTPGATRFYRSDGLPALQRTQLSLKAGARLEWVPQETICYSGCIAENRLMLDLEPEAELMGWDITALGLPHAKQPFVEGRFHQHLELPGVWLERGTIAANDSRLLHSPAGLAGQQCLALAFFITGSPMGRARRQNALDCARAVMADHELAAMAGITSPNTQVIVLRALAPVVEPAMDLIRAVRTQWLAHLWGQASNNPRIWAM